MGIYRTPTSGSAQQSYAMWRAARLVIDTGIHRYGWSRQQAIDYLASHTALSQHEVETEVDRYISWPGQALVLQAGRADDPQAPRRSRSEAWARGSTFAASTTRSSDLGAVPLNVLEDQMRLFIRRRQGGEAEEGYL